MKRFLKKSTAAQRIYRSHLRRRHAGFKPDWQAVLSHSRERWDDARTAARNGPKILIATSTGGHPSSPILESLLGVALTLRGADVHFLLCDSLLPACLMAEVQLMDAGTFARKGPQAYFCNGCFDSANGMYGPLGLQIHRFSSFIGPDEVKEADEVSATISSGDLRSHVRDGVSLGEHATAGALRFFARADLGDQEHADRVLRRCFSAALQTMAVTKRLMEAHRFDAVCLNHALYVPQGIVAEVARAGGSRVVAWNVAYRKQSFIFSHNETYHHTLMTEPVSAWTDLPWDDGRDKEVVDYLESRRRSGRDWIAFQAKNPEENLTSILERLNVDPSRPAVGMLTNVAWDAQLHYPANAFPDMLTWVRQTIAYFAGRPDVQLIIRVHPAEVTGGIASRQPVVEEIAKAFPQLPANVHVIPPDSPISTYAVMDACNAVIIYGTKTGVELTSRGVPVIVAGEAWIRNKGITIDAETADDYFRVLDTLPFGARMTGDAITRARKYAYHFFFRRMIPVTQVTPSGVKDPPFRLNVSRVEDVLPGRSRGLDTICDGIIRGMPFTYRAEDAASTEDER